VAEIVGIHGIAQEFSGRFSLEQLWLASVRDGLAAATYHALAEALTSRHLRVAFFGNLFRRPGTMGGQEYPYSASDLRPGLELDLLAELYQTASAGDAGPEESMRGGRVTAQAMVERLLRNKTFAGVARHALVGTLKQVALFLSDQSTKERVLEQVRDAVHDDTRVLIGHSMGSVVAYEYLCRYQPSGIRLLVTLGSPLGIRNLIFDRLTPAPVAGVGVWPGKADAWVNVADPNDVVALRKELSGLWSGSFSAYEITDRRADNGDQPHSVSRYLNSRQAGAALGEALRGVLG
jgi:alpha/beta hydrolase fold